MTIKRVIRSVEFLAIATAVVVGCLIGEVSLLFGVIILAPYVALNVMGFAAKTVNPDPTGPRGTVNPDPTGPKGMTVNPDPSGPKGNKKKKK